MGVCRGPKGQVVWVKTQSGCCWDFMDYISCMYVRKSPCALAAHGGSYLYCIEGTGLYFCAHGGGGQVLGLTLQMLGHRVFQGWFRLVIGRIGQGLHATPFV